MGPTEHISVEATHTFTFSDKMYDMFEKLFEEGIRKKKSLLCINIFNY